MTGSGLGDERGLKEDSRRVYVVRKAGPDSQCYLALGEELRDYAIGTFMQLLYKGQLHATIARKTKPLPTLPRPPQDWTEFDFRSLVGMAVCRSVEPFLKSAVLEGGWNPDKGARLMTYFVGRCFFAYRDDYLRAHRTAADAIGLLGRAHPDLELEAVNYAWRSATPGPEQIIVDRDQIRWLLQAAPDGRMGVMAFLQSEGLRTAEIADYLGVEKEEVEAEPRRLRRAVRRKAT